MIPIVGIPVARGFLGWLENALEDRKISKLEIMSLFGTIIRIGVPAVFLWLGVDASPTTAASVAAVGDVFIHKIASKLS
ncbi:MAG: hypothetical protein ACTSSP_05605 [Candidatus Asgardarchaeia archaeon]